jgi:hypothetical protein
LSNCSDKLDVVSTKGDGNHTDADTSRDRPWDLIDRALQEALAGEPELERISADPDLWSSVDLETLAAVLRRELIRYGVSMDPLLVEPLSKLYQISRERLSVEERLELLALVIEFVDDAPSAVNALLPFIFMENDFTIITSASLALAVMLGNAEGESLSGPSYVHALVEQIEDPVVQAGLYAGLLLTGDARLYELTDRCWDTVSAEARLLLASIPTDFPTVFLASFYIDWLESLVEGGDDEEFGAVAAALARIALNHARIVDVERAFPSWKDDEHPPITFKAEWTIPQFGRRIEPRLRDIMELESEPKIMETVLQYWGISDQWE